MTPLPTPAVPTPADPTSLPDIIGGVAAAVAIAGALYGLIVWTYRHYRRWKLRDQLRTGVREITRLDDLLRKTTWDMDQLFSKGFPWAGYAIFIGGLGDNLNTLQQIAGEIADVMAGVRALEAGGAEDRLRGDVEAIADGLRRVTPLYIWGIVHSYRTAGTTAITESLPPDDGPNDSDFDDEDANEEWSMTVQIPPSATGREPTRTLKLEDRETVRDLRLALRVLFRSVTARLDMNDLKDAPFAAWPIDMAESYQNEAKLRAHLTIPYEHY